MMLWMIGAVILAATTNFFIIPRIWSYNSAEQSDDSTLVLLHVLFRHGDRAPDQSEVYPNDPHTGDAFADIGYGQLTQEGRYREYLIGKSLRQKYDRFLGLHRADTVSARSTDYVRTRMSCLLVLSGLYPPAPEQMWEESILWQPIPYDYETSKQDRILGDPLKHCGPFKGLYQEFMASPNGLQFYKDNKDIYDYVSMHTGWDVKMPHFFYDLYFVLKSEETMGLELPQWTENVWPTNITSLAADEYYVQTSTPRMLRIAAGYLLEKILLETDMKLKEQLPQERRIYLYSGHEHNIAFFLIALGLFKPHVPPFGSYITLEVHKIEGVHGFKILYQDYESSPSEPNILKLDDCNEFCPIDKFKRIVENIIPMPFDCDNKMELA